MGGELLGRAQKVVWVSDLKYVTAAPLDRVIFQQLSRSGEEREWYAYLQADNAPGLDIRVYAVHGTPLMALNEMVPQVTGWLQEYGIEATLDEIQVRSEQAVNDEIKQLIEEVRPHNYPHATGHIGIVRRQLNETCWPCHGG
ncbi:MAG: hypothetical protein JO287_20005 [Pseudonocardiales bacterium]|nr:hypothetical protein [Pseudonocardiales bacterium]